MAYEQRIVELEDRLVATKGALGRAALLERPAVLMRIKNAEDRLQALRGSVREWREAHDTYGVGQAYRECLLLYGGAEDACQAMSFDTLPGQ